MAASSGSATLPDDALGFYFMGRVTEPLVNGCHKTAGLPGARELSGTPAAESLSPILQLQQQAGNQAVQQLLRSGCIQAKLAISNPDDPEEREADSVASTIMRKHAGAPCSCSPGEEMCEECQQKQSAPAIQRRASAPFAPAHVPRIVGDVLLRSPGHPLDSATRAFFEPRFGRDFSDVRIHTGSDAAASARSIDAHAYTAGSDIVFASGQYSPDTPSGRSLLAHELAHVHYHDSDYYPVKRQKEKDAPPLSVEVPDPDPNYSPKYKYPWQNPELRKSIYPYRDEELSFFLRTYMEIDLEDPSVPVPAVSVDELTQERKRLQEELKQVKVELKAAKDAKDTAKTTELSARSHRLEAELKYLPEVTKKDVPKSAARKWAAYRYSKFDDQGNELDQDALLARIIARFDGDTNFQRYPKWLRYMVFHFSGMRYASAHGSYAPAIDLVKRLKHEEITSRLAGEQEIDVASQSKAAITELETELAATDKSKTARRAAIQKRIALLHAVDTAGESVFSKKGNEAKREAFHRLIDIEEERDKLNGELTQLQPSDPAAGEKQKQVEAIENQIHELEGEIGPTSLREARKQRDAAKLKRRAALVEYEIERADSALSQLDDMQALSVLKALRDKKVFPEWVWKEIVRVTALKLEVEEGVDWETVTPEEKKEKSAGDAITKRWRQIMASWKKDVTGWREKHGNDLSLVVIRAVCNEICEMSLHARGVSPEGGIAQKAKWYAAKGSGRSFTRPTKEADLKPGASLFFMEWSMQPAQDAVSIVRHDLGFDLRSEKGAPISDGLEEPGGFSGVDTWTYHFNSDKTVTRTAPVESLSPTLAASGAKPHQGTMYLNWKHEAMVVQVDAPAGRVVTFETGPIGLRIRYLKGDYGVLDKWSVFVGFAESTKERAGIDEYLKDILPAKSTTSSPASTP
jgi:hypothetical protein